MCAVIQPLASRSSPSSRRTLPAPPWLSTGLSDVPMKKALTTRTEPPVRSVLIGRVATASHTNAFSKLGRLHGYHAKLPILREGESNSIETPCRQRKMRRVQKHAASDG